NSRTSGPGDRRAAFSHRRPAAPAPAPAAARVQAAPAGARLDDRIAIPLAAARAACAGEFPAEAGARRHLGPENPGLPGLLRPGHGRAPDPLLPLEGRGQCPPARPPASARRLTHGYRV